ncbi:MAG: CDP-glycerol glycerophosphotransferase family protein [Rhabdochlamydiaceae bacterium]|nr:CDP-glycerol glycerophosphotransferase family protein [Candidatus Amphrikana amoebophyrae]
MKLPEKQHLIGLLLGDNEHHLDHITPLVSLLNIPMIITEERIYKLAQKHYPDTQINYVPTHEIRTFLPNSTQALISCLPAPQIKLELLGLNIPTIWLPHGNSDKGRDSYFMEGLKNEQYAFLYGNQILNFLKEKGAYENLEGYAFIGNYRNEYFKRDQTGLKWGERTILYAPSWQPHDKTHILIEELSQVSKLSNHNVLIKLHPNTIKLSDIRLNLVLNEIANYDHITLIDSIPTIYPLLSQVDLLIGDTSSIGYDFLTFDKPLIFIENNQKHHMENGPLTLQQVGTTINISELDNIDQIIKKDDKSEQRRWLYNETFSPLPAWMRSERLISWKRPNISLHL